MAEEKAAETLADSAIVAIVASVVVADEVIVDDPSVDELKAALELLQAANAALEALANAAVRRSS